MACDHDLLEVGKQMPVGEACEYGRQAALGLQHAFEDGMVHRDIKPQNLMRTTRGQIKILDFGLARFASEVATHAGVTAEGMILGSADYIAPEQVDDPHAADIRADLYSLGCTLYFLLAGRPGLGRGALSCRSCASYRSYASTILPTRRCRTTSWLVSRAKWMSSMPSRMSWTTRRPLT